MSSIAPAGMETPVRRNSSAFQPKCTNCSPSFPRSLMRSRTRIPTAITSGPIPSPGTTAILRAVGVIGGGLYGEHPQGAILDHAICRMRIVHCVLGEVVFVRRVNDHLRVRFDARSQSREIKKVPLQRIKGSPIPETSRIESAAESHRQEIDRSEPAEPERSIVWQTHIANPAFGKDVGDRRKQARHDVNVMVTVEIADSNASRIETI